MDVAPTRVKEAEVHIAQRGDREQTQYEEAKAA
jgi:hypothetical protein